MNVLFSSLREVKKLCWGGFMVVSRDESDDDSDDELKFWFGRWK